MLLLTHVNPPHRQSLAALASHHQLTQLTLHAEDLCIRPHANSTNATLPLVCFCFRVGGASDPQTAQYFEVHVPGAGRADDVMENTTGEKNAWEGDFSTSSLGPGTLTSAINNRIGNSTRVSQR